MSLTCMLSFVSLVSHTQLHQAHWREERKGEKEREGGGKREGHREIEIDNYYGG